MNESADICEVLCDICEVLMAYQTGFERGHMICPDCYDKHCQPIYYSGKT